MGAIRRVTDLPIKYVINTHVHPDHVLGNAAFPQDTAAFVGHAKLPRAMAARGAHYLQGLQDLIGSARGTVIVEPGLTVAEQSELDLGGGCLS